MLTIVNDTDGCLAFEIIRYGIQVLEKSATRTQICDLGSIPMEPS